MNFGKEESMYVLPTIQMLRQKGLYVELYPDAVKIGKQFTYANNQKIPYVVIAGEEEIKSCTFQIKNMETGMQKIVNQSDLLSLLSNLP